MHFDLDFPREPQVGETGATSTRRPAARSDVLSTSFAATRWTRSSGSAPSRACAREDLKRRFHGDARELALSGPFDGIVTSPPYPGLIDYHEQHRYAYELLALDDHREQELGAAERGVSAKAIGAYVDGIASVFANARTSLRRDAARRDRDQRPPRALPGHPGPRRSLDRDPLPPPRQPSHGRRAGEFFEDVIVAR